MTRVYVAAPYADAPQVRAVHERLLSLLVYPTSSWAAHARGEESADADAIARAIDQNDRDLLGSDAVIVLGRDGAGGEMFAEARIAIDRGIPVYWVGRRILSAYRRGVTLCEDVDDAIAHVRALPPIRTVPPGPQVTP